MEYFNINHGIIIECNFSGIDKLEAIVEATNDLDFVVGYKVGAELAISSRIKDIVDTIKKYTNLPVIYDHQKFGSDDPMFSGGSFLETLKNAGVNGLIIFPHGGVGSLEAAIRKCIDLGILPIIGGDMVHEGYTEEEGGYIDNAAPQKMYIDGANFGAKHFVMPCTRLDRMRIYCHRLGNMVNNPILFITGVGIETCDDLVKACEIVKQYHSYVIIGREITDEKDYRKAAEKIWKKLPVSS
jgi:orotidine-5'-phosphate decarboxylase